VYFHLLLLPKVFILLELVTKVGLNVFHKPILLLVNYFACDYCLCYDLLQMSLLQVEID
jgi:hypothetical protein